MVLEINVDLIGGIVANDPAEQTSHGFESFIGPSGERISAEEFYRLFYGLNKDKEPSRVKVTIDGHDFRVNPQQMNWAKAYKIEESEIVYKKDISQWMGPKLWQLTISLTTFTALEKDFLWYLGDDDGNYPGPHNIEAAIPTGSMCMYLKNKTAQQVGGESDSVFYWQLTFLEAHDGGI
ncbi:MAG: hypothetical protein ACE14P_06225 [Methanotrichaceae archaeon]